MDKILVSIFDRKAEYFLSPWVTENDETAKRQFRNLITNVESLISKYPQDYIMYKIGTFNEHSGKITEIHHHVELINGLTQITDKEV